MAAAGWPSTSTVRARLQQPQDLAQQHRLAGARAAHQGQHLAAVDVQVQVLVHGERALAFAKDAPQVDAHHARRPGRRLRPRGRDGGIGHQKPTLRNRMAKTASTRMTMVMDVTTEAVVPWPRLCWVPPAGPSGSRSGDQHAEHHRLAHGQPQIADLHRAGSDCRKYAA
jgi:hypothetical protein